MLPILFFHLMTHSWWFNSTNHVHFILPILMLILYFISGENLTIRNSLPISKIIPLFERDEPVCISKEKLCK